MRLQLLLGLAIIATPSFMTPSAAHAGDGRIEINQDSVQAAGGYPFTISSPGSYLLTSNLDVPTATTGLRIAADGVFLDLNGFAIRGSHVCDQGSCAPGVGYGIERVAGPSDLGHRVTVIDGEISGFGQDCIRLSTAAHAERLVVTSCGGDGIFAGEHSLALENRISACGAFGLRLIDPASFSNNVLAFNGLGGGAGGAFAGGTSGGGNVCDAGDCARAMRRFYLTKSPLPGNHGANVCTLGFHMASAFELVDPSNLKYDTSLGVTLVDSGEGPPGYSQGWVRSGDRQSASANCGTIAPWDSNASFHQGGFLVLQGPSSWSAAGTTVSPWLSGTLACNLPIGAWCIED